MMNREMNRLDNKVEITIKYSERFEQELFNVRVPYYNEKEKCYLEDYEIEVPIRGDFGINNSNLNKAVIDSLYEFNYYPAIHQIENLDQKLTRACNYLKNHSELSQENIIKYSVKITGLLKEIDEEVDYVTSLTDLIATLNNQIEIEQLTHELDLNTSLSFSEKLKQLIEIVDR